MKSCLIVAFLLSALLVGEGHSQIVLGARSALGYGIRSGLGYPYGPYAVDSFGRPLYGPSAIARYGYPTIGLGGLRYASPSIVSHGIVNPLGIPSLPLALWKK